MVVHILGQQNSIINQFIAELRNVNIQKDSMRFRRNLERIGEIFAYEISKYLPYKKVEVTTPLGISNMQLPAEKPVLATILRAGLPLHQGFLNYYDGADNCFISAYRKHHKDGTFEIAVEYMSSPDLTDRIVILSDPMLATGKSMVLTYQAMAQINNPRHTHLVSVIASVDGVNYVKAHLPKNCTLWLGAVDEELTAHAYIVPGLGDAGDLAYGTKK
jgi:uracil phosphoribosyltransferase